MDQIGLKALGQVGYRIDFGGTVLFIDPYLSDFVSRHLDCSLVRLLPVEIQPNTVTDADWICITHAHADHCDPDTLVPMSLASPGAQFLCSGYVATILEDLGIAPGRIEVPEEHSWVRLGRELQVSAVPAAHPRITRDSGNRPICLGFVFDFCGRRLFHAGDTSPQEELLALLRRYGGFEAAFLPVNEDSFFLRRRGIIGNMTVREAFDFAVEIGAKRLIPTHWDMFAGNGVPLEEIRLVYQQSPHPFSLEIYPTRL
ncbi:MAG: MBL fold metallo-hydrolase [Bacillota bacterium]|nr:MBL fold metallo-hydrolase [Bacillota bacterium]